MKNNGITKIDSYFKVFIFLTVVIFLVIPNESYSKNLCESIFQTVSIKDEKPLLYGSLKEKFKLDKNYKVLVSDQSDIKNQCSLGTCHLHSWISELEKNYKTKTHQDLKISSHYLSVSHWMRKSLELLNSDSENKVSVKLGENVYGSRSSILNSGIIPDENWTGSRDFQSAVLSSRINEYIKNIVARAKWNSSQQTDSNKALKIKESAKQEIIAVFENLVGKLPEKFNFQGKEYTPQSFQQAYFPELTKPITNLSVNSERKAKTRLLQSGTSFSIISANLDIVESTLRKLLDSNKNVYISYDHNSQFVDSKTGIMSISAFEFPTGSGPLSRKQRAYFKMESSGHAVQIVGYDFDAKTNKVIKWKLKNSWGEKTGDNGYYHMFSDYFRAFVTSISFFSDPNFTPVIEERNSVQLKIQF